MGQNGYLFSKMRCNFPLRNVSRGTFLLKMMGGFGSINAQKYAGSCRLKSKSKVQAATVSLTDD